MNWIGYEIQKYISKTDSVLDLGCGIGQSVLNTGAYLNGKLECSYYKGVDAFQPYLDHLQERGFNVLNWDLRKTPLPFQSKSYDHVLFLDIFEHMENLDQADALFKEGKRIARKKIFVVTPKRFFDNLSAVKNPFPYEKFREDNPLQEHKCLITAEWLKRRGFKVDTKINRRLYFAFRNVSLKILHVWDVAGVSHVLTKYQRLLGHDAYVIKRKGHDRSLIDAFYESHTYNIECKNSLQFYLAVRSFARLYDIVHIHSSFLTVLFIPFKKMVLEFHGSDVRSPQGLKAIILKLFLSVFIWIKPFLISTPDLKEQLPDALYLHNPVDVDHFNKTCFKPQKNMAVYITQWYEDYGKAFEIAGKHGLGLILLDRANGIFIPYEDFPQYLGLFEYFIDRYSIKSLSKTALECLSMGLKVIAYNGEVLYGLPIEHNPLLVANRTIELYEERLFNG